MGDTVEALKALAVAMGCATKASDITTETIPETIQIMTKNYPSKVFWCGKSMDGNPEIGIVSMSIQFEIQYTKPDYVDLSNIGDDNDVEMPDGESEPGAIVPDENYSSDFIGFVTANESKINELVNE